MKNEVIELFREQLKQYEKISMPEAKRLLNTVKNEKNIEVKQKVINEVYHRTLHNVLSYIETQNYQLIKSCNFDMNDIITCAFTIWYEKVKSFEIIQHNVLNDNKFSKEITEMLIPYDDELINRADSWLYVELLKHYIDERNETQTVDKDKFYIKYCGDAYKFLTRENINNVFYFFEKLYLELSDNDKKEVVLNKRNIIVLSRLFEEMMTFEKLDNNYIEDTFNEKILNEATLKDLKQVVTRYLETYVSERNREIVNIYLESYENDEPFPKFKEIANQYDISIERVRQIIFVPLSKIKRLKKVREIKKEFY